jgi:hypothetical protein
VWAVGSWDGTLQWGRGFAATERRCTEASRTSALRLQWGRGFTATESRGRGRQPRRLVRASMGPWLHSHGKGLRLSRFAPRAKKPLCENPGVPWTSFNQPRPHGLRKPLPRSRLGSRERPPLVQTPRRRSRRGLKSPYCQGSRLAAPGGSNGPPRGASSRHDSEKSSGMGTAIL